MVNGVISVILAAILAFSSYTTPSETVETTYIEPQEGVYRIGINQLVSHPALDAATNGFKDVLTEKLGDKVVFDWQNAMGDYAASAQIANTFVEGNYDLIFANASVSLISASNATTEIPILGTAVTDYGVVLERDVVDGVIPGNISGTCDLPSANSIATIILELFPDCKKVGFLYGAQETQSLNQMDELDKLLSAKGIECTYFPFEDSDVEAVIQSACEYSDVLFTPNDNSVAYSAETIDSVLSIAGVPVVSAAHYLPFAVAAPAIDYYRLGRVTGEMAYRILAEGEDISTMPIEYDENCTKMYNASIAEELGITVPEDYIPIE